MKRTGNHSPYCHKCPHNGQADEACLSCKGFSDAPNNHGQTFVSLDSHDDAVNILTEAECTGIENIDSRQPWQYEDPAQRPLADIGLSDEAREPMTHWLARFSQLSYEDAGMVCALLRGVTFAEMAKKRGENRQAVQNRWKALEERHPDFAATITGQIGRAVVAVVASRKAKAKAQPPAARAEPRR